MSKFINNIVKMFFATKVSQKHATIKKRVYINYGSISELEPFEEYY